MVSPAALQPLHQPARGRSQALDRKLDHRTGAEDCGRVRGEHPEVSADQIGWWRPLLFNLYTNPREDEAKPSTESWIIGPVLKMVGEFEASTRKFPPIRSDGGARCSSTSTPTRARTKPSPRPKAGSSARC